MNASSTVWQGAGRRIHLQEVGLRDGLQMEKAFVPTEDKIALANALSAAGLAKIEVTSFTSPTAIPALKDAEIVMREITRRPGTVYTALVPNLRGAERAIEARTDELNLVMSVSATHNLANLRMTQEQSFAALAQVTAMAQGANVAVNVSLSCVFGCPMEGEVVPAEVLGWVQRFVDLGVRGITLCDTTGMAYPTQVHQLTAAARARWPGLEFTLHFHNTRGMGLANVLAAIDAGARWYSFALPGDRHERPCHRLAPAAPNSLARGAAGADRRAAKPVWRAVLAGASGARTAWARRGLAASPAALGRGVCREHA